jgi:hypothetical protein
MQSLTEKVLDLDPPHGLFDKAVVSNLFPSASAGARRALVHRAAAHDEVLQLKPGLYCLADRLRRDSPHPFALAGLLYSPSFVSGESALWYHGLIPEALAQVDSVIADRSRTFTTPLGRFSYRRVPCRTLKAGVAARRVSDDEWAFVANPLRAIGDLVYVRKKVSWKGDGLRFLTESMRVEETLLRDVSTADAEDVLETLNNRRVRDYIRCLVKELMT